MPRYQRTLSPRELGQPLTLLAFGQDSLLQTIPHGIGQGIDLVLLVDLDGLACGAESDLAVLASAQMFFQIAPQGSRNMIVDQVVELS